MKTVIIGGGTAGIGVATALRRRDENAEIVILEKSDELAVATSGLPYYLAGIIKEQDRLIGATVDQMADIFRVTVKLGHEVVNIDREKKTLTIEGREEENYEKLVLATGAMTLRPDIPGILGDNIFTIRTLASVEKIRDYYYGTGSRNVLIVGGGCVGVDIAQAFTYLDAKVTLVEAQSHILPYYDADMTAQLQNQLRDKGVCLRVDTLVKEFRKNEADLDDGSTVHFDLAVIATGVKPDVKLPVMADLELGSSGGLWVNSYLQTTDPDIYACGDNIEITRQITGDLMRWPSAELSLKQARVVAENLAGGTAKFGPVLGTSIETVFGLTASKAGASEYDLKNNGIEYRKLHLLEPDHACFLPDSKQMVLKLLFSPEGQILGIQAVGPRDVDKRVAFVGEVIRVGGSFRELKAAEMAYAPPYSIAKDSLNNLGYLAGEVVRGQTSYVFIDELDWDQVGSEIMLIDTRSPQSFKAGHIAHAVNFPLATLRDNLASIPRDKQVVLYCGHGYGAYNAYCILNQRGYENVYLLSGSMDLYMEMALNDIYNDHACEQMEQVWNRLQFANDDEIGIQ